MKKLSKRFVQTLCVMLTCAILSAAAPRKAEAGIGLFLGGMALPLAAAIPASTAGAAMIIGGPVAMTRGGWISSGYGGGFDRPGLAAISILMLILDDESSASEHTEAALAQRYSFIEDRTVIGELAQAFTLRANETPADENGMKLVRLSRNEITDILAPTDVMENHPEQVEQMIRELE